MSILDDILSGLAFAGNVVDTPWGAIRTAVAKRDVGAGLESIFDFDKRASGKAMLNSLFGEFEGDELAGLATEILPDMLLPGAGAYKLLSRFKGAKPAATLATAAPEGRGFLDAIDKAVPTPMSAGGLPEHEVLRIVGSNPILEAAEQMPLALSHQNIPKQLADQMPLGLPAPVGQGLNRIADDRPIYQQWDDLRNQFDNAFDAAADGHSFDAVNKALLNRRFQEKGIPSLETTGATQQVPEAIIENLHTVSSARNAAGDDLMRAVRENARSAFAKRLHSLPEYTVGSYRPENAAELLLNLKNMWGEPYLDDVLKQDLGLTGIRKLVNPDYATKAFSNREKAVNDIARDLAGRLLSHKNLDFEGVMGPNSALTNEGKLELVDWFRAAAEALYDSSAEATLRHQEFKRGQPLMNLAPFAVGGGGLAAALMADES